MAELQVISGGAQALPAWLAFPTYCEAAHPGDRRLVKVRISGQRALASARLRRNQPAFELWSVILGKAPPVPGVGYSGNHPGEAGLSRLADAHACFHGLKRPVAESDQGDEMLTYVSQPSYYYRFDTQYAGAMVTVARRLPVPEDLLFLTHVRQDQTTAGTDSSYLGTVTHWGFVSRSKQDRFLPVDFESRFSGRHW